MFDILTYEIEIRVCSKSSDHLMEGCNSIRVKTTSGEIAVLSAGTEYATNPTLLLIHGNSFCSKIWRHILQSSTITSTRRVLAIDLPGHGDSSNAIDPATQYTQPGYARCAIEVLKQLNVKKVVVLGWSLGGHIGIEMLPLVEEPIRMVGLMIVGTPPTDHGEADKAFIVDPGGFASSIVRANEVEANTSMPTDPRHTGCSRRRICGRARHVRPHLR